jgi:hypothetical protein
VGRRHPGAAFLPHPATGFDASLRTGPEYGDPSRGRYELDRIRLADLADVDLRPIELRDFILANTAALLADLPTAR